MSKILIGGNKGGMILTLKEGQTLTLDLDGLPDQSSTLIVKPLTIGYSQSVFFVGFNDSATKNIEELIIISDEEKGKK